MSLDPDHCRGHEDITMVWSVLNPEGLQTISFSDFMHGMIRVKADPDVAEMIKLDAPNKWELLSLLIDSPISEEQVHRHWSL